jgi:hypothetical protein
MEKGSKPGAAASFAASGTYTMPIPSRLSSASSSKSSSRDESDWEDCDEPIHTSHDSKLEDAALLSELSGSNENQN